MTSAVNCHLTFAMTILSAQSAEQKTAESRTTIKIYFKFSFLVNPLHALHASTITTHYYTHFSCCSHFFLSNHSTFSVATTSVLLYFVDLHISFLATKMATEWKNSTVGFKIMWHEYNLKVPYTGNTHFQFFAFHLFF